MNFSNGGSRFSLEARKDIDTTITIEGVIPKGFTHRLLSEDNGSMPQQGLTEMTNLPTYRPPRKNLSQIWLHNKLNYFHSPAAKQPNPG